LVLIIGLAIFIRLYGVGFGLPYITHPDEPTIFYRAFTLPLQTYSLNPDWFIYPSLYIHIQSFVYGLVYVVNFILGIFRGTFVHIKDISEAAFYIWGRVTTALFGTLTVYIAYLVGKETFNKKTGLLAASMLSVYLLHVDCSHHIKVDVPMGFFLLTAFYFAWKIFETSEKRCYILAGLFAGFTISTKYTGGLIIIPIILAHLFSDKKERVFDKKIISTLFFIIGGFILTSPYALAHPRNLMNSTLYAASYYAAGGTTGHGGTFLENLRFYFSYLYSVGLSSKLLAIVGLLGTLSAIFRHKKRDIIILSFPFSYLVFLCFFKCCFTRSLIPILPFIALLGAGFVVKSVEIISKKLAFGQSSSNILLILLSLAILIIPLKKVVLLDQRIAQKGTRVESMEWINTNLPRGSKIAFEGYSPPVSDELFETYSIETLIIHDLDWYLVNGFDYLIASSSMYGRFYTDPIKYKEQISSYEKIFSNTTSAKEFKGDWHLIDSLNIAYPTIRIMKVNKIKIFSCSGRR